jgi:hypothetical protein
MSGARFWQPSPDAPAPLSRWSDFLPFGAQDYRQGAAWPVLHSATLWQIDCLLQRSASRYACEVLKV